MMLDYSTVNIFIMFFGKPIGLTLDVKIPEILTKDNSHFLFIVKQPLEKWTSIIYYLLKDELFSHKKHIHKNASNKGRGIDTSNEDEKYQEIIQRLKRLIEKQKDVDLRMKELEDRIKEK